MKICIHKYKKENCKLICVKCKKVKKTLHTWNYYDLKRKRICSACEKKQYQNPVYVHEGGEVRLYGYTRWNDEEFEGRTKPIPINCAYVGRDNIRENL